MDQEIRDKYQEVIGLEVHVQLSTQTKAYSSDINEYGSLPNTNVSVITLAHPGTLPRSNKKVINYAVKMGLACGCSITEYNYYDRKNYFYPDLPKGYQLTQDSTPICVGGEVEITTKSGKTRKIKMNRIHMEEDAGKSMHLDGEEDTLVDLNRAGTPLLEVVTEPDIRSSEEAYAFMSEIRKLVRYLDVSDGNMEEGSLRCDANISVMLKGATEYGKKVEVKNMNSFRNVQRAIDHEIERQIELVEKEEEVISETRLFDPTTGETRSMRKKEELNDYRYFPEPDLQPVVVDEKWIADIKDNMPPLPNDLKHKYIKEFGLPEYDAQVLTEQKSIALYFNELCSCTNKYKQASNWVMGPVKSYLNELTLDMDKFPLSPERIAEIINLVADNKISHSKAVQDLFPAMLKYPKSSAEEVAEQMDLLHDTDEGEAEKLISDVIDGFPKEIQRYKNGEKKLLGMFMGQVMKATKGKVDPKVAKGLIGKILDSK